MNPLSHQFAAAVVVASVASIGASDSAQQVFAKSWEGRTVTLRRTLYSLVYNERGRLGKTYAGRHDGLTVVTPSSGIPFTFEGRQGKDDIVNVTPQAVFDEVTTAYQEEALDVRSYRKLEPLTLARYDANAEFVISGVRVTGDSVRVWLSEASGANGREPVTSLTVKWPVLFSPSFSERELVEGLMLGFMQPKTTF